MQFIVEIVNVGMIDPVAMRNTILSLVTAAKTGGTLMQTTDSVAVQNVLVRAHPYARSHSKAS
jgi:hypothetical protein